MKTPEQVKQQFRREGKTFAQFAKENNISVQTVYKLLNGQYKGHFGAAHDAAVKLGIKPDYERQAA